MTATDELRRMLDERGVEWTAPNSILRDDMTSWVANGFDYDAFEVPDGTLVLSAAHQDDLTPEQAIAATLGSCNCSNSERTGTCHVEETEHIDISWQDGRHLTIHVMECSECGHTYEHVNGDYEFCPRCGRKVVTNV